MGQVTARCIDVQGARDYAAFVILKPRRRRRTSHQGTTLLKPDNLRPRCHVSVDNVPSRFCEVLRRRAAAGALWRAGCAAQDDTRGNVAFSADAMTTEFNCAGLLIVGHGSTVNPDSSAPTLARGTEIRRRGVFAEVACCFWKEEPSLRDALLFFQDAAIREVYVVPNFISEGYFTKTVIPRELELDGRTTDRWNGQVWKYCEPVGNHSMMTELLLQRAGEVAPGVPERETSLLIVGHGTSLNDNSAVAAKREVEKIRQMNRYAAVLNVYMEEAPLVADWAKLTHTANVVVVPFFISDGLHSYEDIPGLLGIEGSPKESADERAHAGEVFRRNPYQLRGCSLYYANAIGTDMRFADVIVEQAKSFEGDCSSLAGNFARG